MPGMWIVSHSSDYNWGYQTVRQQSGCLDSDGICSYPRGRGVGGSTIINGLAYTRGSPNDFDLWKKLGNTGWNYETVVPYFKKSEDFHKTNPMAPVDPTYHGEDGYWNVEYHYPFTESASAFLNATRELGYKLLDFNGPVNIGYSQVPSNIKREKRIDNNHAFIQPVKNRKNLFISTNSYVTRILIEPKTKVAYGVEFIRDGQIYETRTKMEVIISAGAIGSPQILMQSGIGPKSHLKNLSIPVFQDLEVGSSLKDQPATNFIVCFNETNQIEKTVREMINEYLQGKGFYPFGMFPEVILFTKTLLEKNENYTDLEILITPLLSKSTPKLLLQHLKVPQRIGVNCSSFVINIVSLHVKSSGTVRLKSNNPFDYPLIDPKYYTDPEQNDIKTAFKGLKLAEKLLKNASFQKLNATMFYPKVPQCSKYTYMSKGYKYCIIKYQSKPTYHPIGTCPMGTNPNTGSVVDPQLRVYGIKKLRVADASIFPTPISGHTSAACVMIGERVSDLIKENYIF